MVVHLLHQAINTSTAAVTIIMPKVKTMLGGERRIVCDVRIHDRNGS